MDKRIVKFMTEWNDPKAKLALCRAYELGMIGICNDILTHYGY